jgi:DNA polymerase-3 subunit epsilon
MNDFLDMIRRDEFVVLDTETTGLNRGEIVQIAIIDSSGNALLDSYVKPVRPIPADATRIHRITDEMVASAPIWAELTVTIQSLLSGRDLVVYNAVYDRKMMHQTAEAAGLPKVEWKELCRWHCAMEEFSPIYGEGDDYHQSYRWQKLTTAARYYNLATDGAHTALADCKMTLGVVKAMAAAL